ncbi:MAG TPA: hypothetical protein VN807_01750 [Candidatus Sulfotelmatobacter sp.]|nr:hypothetical protein [Candidatus Sulfotelmatobacter sp.]
MNAQSRHLAVLKRTMLYGMHLGLAASFLLATPDASRLSLADRQIVESAALLYRAYIE